MDDHQLVWRKARASQPSGDCVEVADLGDGHAVRDSKDRQGPQLRVSSAAWVAFAAGIQAGDFS